MTPQHNKGWKLFSLNLQWTALQQPIPGVGVLFDLAPHAFDIMNYILDDWPKRISTYGGAFRNTEHEEHAYIIAEFTNKMIAHVELSWLVPRKTRTVSIVGLNRFAHIEALSQKINVYENEYEYQMEITRNNTIRTELQHFVDCAREGRMSMNSGAVGVRSVEMVEASLASLKDGLPVEVD